MSQRTTMTLERVQPPKIGYLGQRANGTRRAQREMIVRRGIGPAEASDAQTIRRCGGFCSDQFTGLLLRYASPRSLVHSLSALAVYQSVVQQERLLPSHG